MAITLKPVAATYTKIQLHSQPTGGQELKFDFPLAGTTVFREGGDLAFTLDNGESLRIPGFFNTGASAELPRLAFADFPAMTMDDLMTLLAIDPASAEFWGTLYIPQEPLSGGIGNYGDRAGSLINGINTLGMLGTDFYSQAVLKENDYELPFPFDFSRPAVRGVTNPGNEMPTAPVKSPDDEILSPSRKIISFSEDGLMAAPQQTGNLALSQFPGATYALKDGGVGQYGLFNLTPDGFWTYYRTADINFMAGGKKYTEDLPVIISLPDGLTVEWIVAVDITGDNDAPLLNAAISDVDDATLASGAGIRGAITGSDMDEGDSVDAFSLASAPLAFLVEGNACATVDINDYGTLIMNADGSWRFAPQTAAQEALLLSLAPGQQLFIIVGVTASDTHGAAASTTLTITVTGTNQAPEFDAATVRAHTGEDALIAAAGRLDSVLTAKDPEGDPVSYTAGIQQGLYGSFTLAADGTWTYILRPGVDINFMSQGRDYVETFTVTVSDSSGASSQERFFLTITGDNDLPVITGVSHGTADLGAADGVVLSGRVLATDVDEGDSVVNYRLGGPVSASINGIPANLADYGELILNTDGSWHFKAQTPQQQANLQNLPNGSVLTVTAPVQAQDTNGGVGTGTITVDINGQHNNSPALDPLSLNAGILEDALIGAGMLTGTVSAMDADNDPLTYSLAGSSAGTYGALNLSADGNWTYVPTMDINFMAEGQEYTETFRIRVSDGKGGVDEQVLTITITGENDAPAVGAVSLSPTDAELYNGTVFSGTIPVTDPDTGDTATITQGSITAAIDGTSVNLADYGVFILGPDGSWNFQARTQVQKDNMLSLAEGQELVITVPVTATDTQGGTGTSALVITVAGTNQDPVFVSSSLSAGATEESLMADPVLTGQLAATDPDTGDTLAYGVRDGNGIYGSLNVNPDGTWTYTRTGDISFLPPGGGYTEHFTVTVTDGHGNVIERGFFLDISGSNSAPVLQDADAAGTDAALSSGLVLSGRISGTDPDIGDSISYSAGAPGALRGGSAVNAADYGTLVMNADGSWTFEAQTQAQKDAMLSLAGGETLVVTVPVAGTDTHGATSGSTLTITVTGANQAPVFTASTLNASADEDDVVSAGSVSGQLAATDPDTGDTLTYGIKPGTGTGAYGSFTVDPDGTWTYTPTVDINRLAEGETATETFTAVVSDGHGGTSEQTFTLTLTGDNDAPVLQAAAATSTDSVLYGGTTLFGSITGTDVDGDGISYSAGTATATIDGSTAPLSDYGVLTVNADGAWNFQAQTQIQKDNMLSLADGETLVVTVPVTGTDPHGATGGSTLTITIAGTNQGPALQDATVTSTDAAIHGGTTLSGSIAGTDPEGDSISYSTGTASALRGSAAVNAANYGTLIMNADGSWTFSAQSQAQKDAMLSLADGETLVVTVPVTGTDTLGATGNSTLTITVAGTNQDPVFTVASLAGSVDEDTITTAGSFNGQLAATDPDTGDTLTYGVKPGTGTGAYGSFTVDPDGTWTYTPTDDINRLTEGETVTETFTAVVSDGHGGTTEQTFTLTLTGDNDAPVLQNATASSNDAALGGGTTLSGSITGTDPEGDSISYSAGTPSALRGSTAVNAADYGTLTMNPDGSWTFEARTQAQKDKMLGLAEDETLVIAVPVTGEDIHGATGGGTLTITVTGTNQGPALQDATVTSTDAAIHGGTTLSGSIAGTDPEGDGISYSTGTASALRGSAAVNAANYGTLVMGTDGSWTFQARTQTQKDNMLSLADGETLTITVPVTGRDTHGAMDDSILTITITGTNQGPVLQAATAASTDAALDSGAILSGNIRGTDPEDDSISYSAGTPGALRGGTAVTAADYGTLIMNADGSWTFEAVTPAQKDNLLSLAQGEKLVITVPVTGTDTHGATGDSTLTITVTGTNQAPEFNEASFQAQIGEDELIAASSSLGGMLAADDPEGDAVAYTPISVQGLYGNFTLAADGAWTYTLRPGVDINFMAQGQDYVETFTVTASDSHGAASQERFTLTITGDNDIPVITGVSHGATDLGATDGVVLTGQVLATDIDEGDSVGNYLISGPASASINGIPADLADYGELVLNVDGSWQFIAQTPEQQTNLQNLPGGQVLTVTAPVQAQDTHGGIGNGTITIEVNGESNNPPAFDPSSLDAGILEDTLISAGRLTGTVSATDLDGDTLTYSLAGSGAGTYGALTLSANGSWTYVPTRDINFMAEGQIYTETFSIRVSDGKGGVSVQNLTITITGENDAPVLQSATVSSDDAAMYGGTRLAGNITGTDPEGDSITYSAGRPDALLGSVAVNAADYGALFMNADGSWKFQAYSQAQKDAMLGLADGERLVITVPVTGTDGQDAGNSTLTITVTGTNQGPVLQAVTATASDAAMYSGTTVSGTIMGTDPEGDPVTYGAGSATATLNGVEEFLPDYGVLTVNADGTWTFKAVTQAQKDMMLGLAEGENLIISVPVSGTDGTDTGNATLTITITGTNQAPDFSAASLLAQTTEDALIEAGDFSGVLAADDPEGDAVTYTAAVQQGLYGTFTLAADGTWTYVLRPGVDINFMAQGQSYVETFTVTVSDSHGAATEQELSLFIEGDNDAPVITDFSQSALDLNAADGAVLTGQFLAADMDEGDSVGNYRINGPVSASVNGVSVDLAEYGELTLNADGSWRLTAQTPEQLANLQALPVGDILSLTLTVLVQDSHGASGSKTVTIDVNGRNNAPVLTPSGLDAEIGEDALIGAGMLTGTLSATDADNDALAYSLAGDSAGTWGSLTLLPDGSWTYVPTTDINFMAEGQEYTETFRVRVSDGKGGIAEQNLTITITGDNDTPVVGAISIAPVDTELHSGTVFSGTIPVTDPDSGDTVTIASGNVTAVRGGASVNPNDYGVFTLAPDGAWTFQAQTQAQKDAMLSLAEGETLVITVPVTGSDTHGATDDSTLTITVTGTNQEPVFVGSSLSVGTTENALMANPELTGRLAATDPDTGDVLVYGLKAGEGNGAYGTLTVNPDGTWTYTRTGDLGFLEPGESVAERFIVTVSDGHGGVAEQTFILTIDGDGGDGNSAPVLENATATGTDSALQGGTTLYGTIAGTDADGDPISYTGGKVAATRGGTPVTLADYGALVVDADGTWTFEAQTQAQKDRMLSLAEGENLVITVPVTGTDTHGATGGAFLTITVAGTNQAPVFVGSSLSAAAVEDAVLDQGSLSGQLAAADPDTGDALTFSIKPGTGTGEYGIFSMTAGGKWTYVPSDAINRLAAGQIVTETFTAIVSDGHGGTSEQTFTLTLTGDNDAPVLRNATASSDDAAMYSGAPLVGNIAGADPEGDSISYSAGTATATVGGNTAALSDYGVLIMNADGSWTFEAQTQTQKDAMLGLGNGETLVVTVPVTGTDPHGSTGGSTLIITVTGTNQAPAFTVTTLSAAAHEDDAASAGSISGQLAATDPDTGDTLTYGIKPGTGTGAYGSFSVNPDGTWTYTPTGDINRLAEGQIVTEIFIAVVSDGHGGTSEQTFTLTLTGDNDAPVLQAAVATSTDADLYNGTALSGSITGTDVDGDEITFSAGAPSAVLNGAGGGNTVTLSDYGVLTVNADGTWSFEAVTQDQKDKTLSLGTGETLVITVPVAGTDPHGAAGNNTLTITVTGTNQAPDTVVIVENPVVIPTHEDAMLAEGFSLKGSLNVRDPEGDPFTYMLLGASVGDPNTVVGLYGVLTVNPVDGSWTYTRFPGMDLNFMTEGQDYLDTFTVFMKDDLGAMAERKIIFSISGDNDAPVINGTTQGTVVLDPLLGVTVNLTGRILASDVDEGDTISHYDIVDGSLALDISGQRVTLDRLGDVLDGLFDPLDPLLNTVGTLLNNILGQLGRILDNTAGLGDLLILDSDTGQWTLLAAPLNAVLNLLEGVTDALRNIPGLDDVLLDTLLVSLPWLDFNRNEDLLSLKVTVTAQDNHGAPAETEITIGILGGNNSPRFDGAQVASEAGEDALMAAHFITGTLSATDSENDPLTYALADGGHGRYGTLTVAADGTWTYTLTKDISLLAEGEVYTEEFTVMVSDGHGGRDEQTVSVRITGDNDAPAFEIASLASVVMEDGVMGKGTASGQLSATDPDNGAVLTYSLKEGTGTGAYGTFSVNSSGEWTYTPTPSLASLDRGQNAIETCTVVVTDEHGAQTEQTFTLTVVGTGDVPMVDVTGSLSTTETAMLAGGFGLSGHISAHEAGDTYTYTLLGASAGSPGSATGLYGTLTLNPADGSWTYVRVPGMDLNFMAGGQEYVDEFSVLVRDTATGALVEKQISFSISGDNDAPTLNGTLQDQAGLANPTNNVTDLTGRILAFDVDEGDILSFSKAGSATLLLDGKPLVLSVADLLATVLNTVVLHLTGPILGGLVSSLVTPLLSGTIGPLLNAALNPVLSLLGGAIIDLDEDTGQWTVLSNSLSTILNGLDGVVNGILGTLINALDANILISDTVLGAIKNDLLNNIPLLGFNRNSSALALDIPFHVQDSHGASDTATIDISILGGLNYAPAFVQTTLTAAPVGENALAGAHFITGTLSATDQNADILTYALVTEAGDDWGGHGKYGSLTLDKATGTWTYTLTMDIGFMARGESYIETFQVVVRDGRGGQDVRTLRITISGENDAPVFDVASLNPLVTNESFVDRGFASGQLAATDPDTGATLTYSVKDDGTGTHGRLTVSATGEWRYTPSAFLTRGQMEVETFTVVVTDEHGAATEQTFTLTVVGTNQAPEVILTAEANTVVTDEDAMLADGFSINGSLSLHDPEGNLPGTYTLLDASGAASGSVAGLYGILTLDPATGNWTYVRFPGMDLNFMAEGEKYVDTFRVLVEDSLGATAEKEIIFSINGRNDAPVITGVSQGTIQLNPLNGNIAVDLTGRILAFDIDEGDTVSRYDIVDGSLVLDISGKRIDLNHLGDVLAGLLDPADPLLNLVGTLLNNILGQVGRILDNTAGLGDLLILDSDTGQWTLLAGPLNAILNLLEGITDAVRAIPGVDAILDPLLVSIPWLGFKRNEDLLSLKVTVTAQDNHDAPAEETEITIGILGGNSAPRFTGPEVARDISETDLIAAHYITGTLIAADSENDVLTFAVVDSGHGRYGALTVLADGTWTYTLTKDVSGLAQAETYAEIFTVMVSDGHGGQDEQTMRITITGTGEVAAADLQVSSFLEPVAAGNTEGWKPLGAREPEEAPMGTPEAQAYPVQDFPEQARTGFSAEPEPLLLPSQEQTVEDETENSLVHSVSPEAGIAALPAVMDTLNEEYGPLNALLLHHIASMEPQEDTFVHTLLHEMGFASSHPLSGEEHTPEVSFASSPIYLDNQGIQAGAESCGQDSGPLRGRAMDYPEVEPGLIADRGMDAVQSLSRGEVPPVDSIPDFSFMQNIAPELDDKLLALQIALLNG